MCLQSNFKATELTKNVETPTPDKLELLEIEFVFFLQGISRKNQILNLYKFFEIVEI